MASKHLIRLYDVQSKRSPPAWSPNVWRTRFVLNYKRIPHKTEWVAYPDITDVLSAVGAPPTRTELPLYTVPAIVDEVEGNPPKALSDSPIIADYLEENYPTPTIYPGGRDAQMSYAGAVGKHFMMNAAFMVIPNTVKILDGRELEYFVTSRKAIFGIGVEDMFPPEKQAAIWTNLEAGLNALSAFIDELKPSGAWLFGNADGPGYADFVLGAAFIWFKYAGPEAGWARIEGLNGGRWGRHLENLKPYMQVL